MPRHCGVATSMLPSKCCCCSLRAGSIVIGSFSLVVALTFVGLTATGAVLLTTQDCINTYVNGRRLRMCASGTDSQRMVANLMAILAMLNVAEVVMSIGLIWGGSKRILNWVSGWLIMTSSWILLHSALALAYVCASTDGVLITVTSLVGIFLLGMALLSILTVLSFRNEMLHSRLSNFSNEDLSQG